jgi:alpha-mannosidase
VRAGLAVLNDGKYGHDVLGGDIGITAVRSPVYAWHEPKELDPDEVYSFQDQGRQEFTYRLVPHGGDWRDASVVRLAAELNQPAFPLLESYHDGDLPQVRSFLSVSGESVVASVLKLSEDGPDAVVVRAYETAGHACEATIEVFDRTITATFGPAEIKTFRVPRDPAAPVVETDLIEWPQ